MKWYLREATVLKIVSLLIALILWVLVLSGRNFQVSKALTLRLMLPPSLVASNSPPHYVHFHFRGPKVILKGLEKRLDYIPVDLTRFEAGEHRIAFHEEMLGTLPVGVKVTSIEPPAIRVKLDPLQERVVRVIPVIKGEPAEGFIIEKVDVQPPAVVIRGAESRLASISSVPTEAIVVDGLKDTKVFERQVIYEFRSGVPREDRPPAKIRVQVKELPVRRLFANLPIAIMNDPHQEFAVSPNTVEVRLEGPSAVLRGLDASKIKAVLTLNPLRKSLKSQWHAVELQLDLLENSDVRVVETSPQRVRLMRRSAPVKTP